MGTREGSIIATIIRIHIPTNEAAAAGQVWPGIRIQAIDIVQPPGIGISPIPAMDAHQRQVPTALAANRSAERPRKVRSEDRGQQVRGETAGRTTMTASLSASGTRRGGATRRRSR